MDISKLQNAQSFQVRKVDSKQSRAELVKSLENNDKVDMVLEDEATKELYVVSGEKIDLKELNTALGSAIPKANLNYLNDREIIGAMNLDENKDGFLTEKELKYSKTEALSEGLDRAADTLGGGIEVGSIHGMGYGLRAGMALRAPNAGSTVGVGVGGFLGGIAGLVSAPFTGAAKAYQVSGTYQEPTWSNFRGAMRTLR